MCGPKWTRGGKLGAWSLVSQLICFTCCQGLQLQCLCNFGHFVSGFPGSCVASLSTKH